MEQGSGKREGREKGVREAGDHPGTQTKEKSHGGEQGRGNAIT